jgi:hypothetical protein
MSIFRQLPCKHLFHQPCIDKWMCKRDASCPLCRQTFYDLSSAASIATPTAHTGSMGENDTRVSRAAFLRRWKGLLHISGASSREQT